MLLASRFVAALCLAAAACAGRPGPAPPASGPASSALPSAELIGEFNIPPLTTFDGLRPARFGGISGLASDELTGELYGICDDRADSRVFVFRVAGERTEFKVGLRAYFPLPADRAAPRGLDPEGIAMTRRGRMFVSSEGIGNREPRIPAAIVEYARGLNYVRQLEIPAKFATNETGPIVRGVRENAGFESLTLSPDDRWLYTAAETALAQDGPPADFSHGTRTRIIEFEAEGETYVARREFAYPLDAVQKTDFTPGFMINGLVELVSLGGTELASLEREYAQENGGTGRDVHRIRVYRVSTEGATDVSAIVPLASAAGIRPVRKTLLLDLGSVQGLSPELARLDNFEGMWLGPRRDDGRRDLLVVSDDNFSPRQRTSFLLFRVKMD